MERLYYTIYLNNGAEILKSFSCMKLETDINRFIEAQEVLYFFGYKQALQKVKNGRKANIGYGTYFHNSDVWDAVVGHRKYSLQDCKMKRHWRRLWM